MQFLLSAGVAAIFLVASIMATLLWIDGSRHGWTDEHVSQGATFSLIAVLTFPGALLLVIAIAKAA